jgi:beta-lactamase class A
MGTPKNRTAAFATPLVLVWGLVSGCAGHGGTEPAHTASVRASATPDGTARALARIEHRYHARLGVFMVDTGTGRTVSYRADERFTYCSASKLLTSSLLLKRATGDRLDRVVTYHASDLEDYSPITSKHVGRGMKLRDVIAAALQYSDNTAANLITGRLGGPQAVQAALRGLGDTAPIVIAILSDRGSKDASPDDALIADATKTGLAALR